MVGEESALLHDECGGAFAGVVGDGLAVLVAGCGTREEEGGGGGGRRGRRKMKGDGRKEKEEVEEEEVEEKL